MAEPRLHYNADIFLIIGAIIGFLLLISNPFYVIVGESSWGGVDATLQIILIDIFTLIFGSALIFIKRHRFPKASSELSVKLGFRQFVLGILMILAAILCFPVFARLIPIKLVNYYSAQVSLGVYLSLFYFALILAANVLGFIEYRQVTKQSGTSEE